MKEKTLKIIINKPGETGRSSRTLHPRNISKTGKVKIRCSTGESNCKGNRGLIKYG